MAKHQLIEEPGPEKLRGRDRRWMASASKPPSPKSSCGSRNVPKASTSSDG